MPTLASKDICTGGMACMNACAKGALNFLEDDEGFLQPFVNADMCVECGLCERSCPEMQKQYHQYEGTPDVYAGWNKIDRCVSSSGGAFSTIARYIIAKGGVVYGATLDENLICKHTVVHDIEGLNSLRGSKYIQSSIGTVYKEVKKHLLSDSYVLFTGTPCQVSGLMSYLGKDYDKLITMDLICHGVPSQAVFSSYIEKMKKRLDFAENEEVLIFEFRRRDGWGFSPSVTTTMNNCRHLFGVDSLYMSAFDKAATFRKSCYTCHYANASRVGDFSVGDFWGLGRHGVSFKHDMTKGVSLFIVNTEKGRAIFNALGDEDFYEQRTLDEAAAGNHNLTKVSRLPHYRNAIIRDFLDEKKSLDDIEKEYKLLDRSLKKRLSTFSAQLGIYDLIKKIYNRTR